MKKLILLKIILILGILTCTNINSNSNSNSNSDNDSTDKVQANIKDAGNELRQKNEETKIINKNNKSDKKAHSNKPIKDKLKSNIKNKKVSDKEKKYNMQTIFSSNEAERNIKNNQLSNKKTSKHPSKQEDIKKAFLEYKDGMIKPKIPIKNGKGLYVYFHCENCIKYTWIYLGLRKFNIGLLPCDELKCEFCTEKLWFPCLLAFYNCKYELELLIKKNLSLLPKRANMIREIYEGKTELNKINLFYEQKIKGLCYVRGFATE